MVSVDVKPNVSTGTGVSNRYTGGGGGREEEVVETGDLDSQKFCNNPQL